MWCLLCVIAFAVIGDVEEFWPGMPSSAYVLSSLASSACVPHHDGGMSKPVLALVAKGIWWLLGP